MIKLESLRRKIGLYKPAWVSRPTTIQLDTHNFCNLKCEYCNVQGSFNLSHGKMPLKTIEYVLRYFQGQKFWCIAPFMNGEPLMDERLPQIMDMAKKYCNTSCVIDTNGTLYENRHLLIHRNLRLVRFTISAVTPETYRTVHGKPLFDKAVSTLRWFLKEKLSHQKAWLHFIATEDNIHELKQYIKRFMGIGRTIFTVHRGLSQINSEQIGLQHFPQFLKNAVPNEPIMINEQNKNVPINPWHDKFSPCQCWGIMPISWDGRILQCVDFPYEYNYGKVGEVDLLEAWKERLQNKMDNPCCNSCSVRFPNWKKLMDRWGS